MGRVLKLGFEQKPHNPESERAPVFPWFVFNNSWHLRCPIVGGKNPTVPPTGEGPDFTAHLNFFNNAFDWCDVARDGTWLCECIDLLHNFDLGRSIETKFDYNICDRPDFIGALKAAGICGAHELHATGNIFADSAKGNFSLATGSQAFRTGWVRSVDRPLSALARLRPQADGSLNRGAIQDYGLIEVADLEAEAATLLAEIGQSGATV